LLPYVPVAVGSQRFKKTRPAGVRPPPRHCIKKKTFSHWPRKSPNPCPTHTQRHRNTREIRLALDLCFDMGQTRRFFYNSRQPPHTRASAWGINPHERRGRQPPHTHVRLHGVCTGNKSPVRDAGADSRNRTRTGCLPTGKSCQPS
jgi:hypothetical protein